LSFYDDKNNNNCWFVTTFFILLYLITEEDIHLSQAIKAAFEGRLRAKHAFYPCWYDQFKQVWAKLRPVSPPRAGEGLVF
jgi:hypothetical protein